MARQILTYTFVNPNTPKAVELLLRKILIEKLCAAQEERNAA
jgi:hypothetical protein